MSHYTWNIEKNAELIKLRGISFELIIYHIERDGLLKVIDHPNKEKYLHQKMFVVNINDYVYLVLFVESDTEVFLKTVIPSRKATKKYLEVKIMSNNLNKEEQEILESYENDEWVSVSTPTLIEKYKLMANSTFKKDKRVNIRMTEMDLELLQERALIEGLPYQTLMSSVLHKFVTGRLTDKNV